MGTRHADVDAVLIGAGQAGLSTAYWLRRYGVPFVQLDGDKAAGGAWQHRWRSLRLDLAHGVADLPGLPMEPSEADLARPAREVVSEYYARYEREFALGVVRPVRVAAVRDAADGATGAGDRTGPLVVEAADGRSWTARAVVNATGTWTRPFVPYYPGADVFRGRQLHVARYQDAEEFRGLRVLVVGGGNSAAQLLAEIAPVAAGTVWATRRPPVFRESEFTQEAGREAVAEVERRVRAGLPPESVVSVTGVAMTPAVRAAREAGAMVRRPMFSRFTEGGAVWDADGSFEAVDAVLWATGFRAALDHLAPLGLRGAGGGIRMRDWVRVADEPRVMLVGYGPSASTIGASRAGRLAARAVRGLPPLLPPAASGGTPSGTPPGR
ncbi:pyridine nucleotide-disulfide oxidoreductase [Mangrovactinospora gilvigrisea]|uniref:Pyridine nucleotide-disulfide oxidoreductase n=1 Tax=Mangrovactinospora gilvigrisea TaxID=1428644 RepID=A0A1J7C3P1_9ACTN|nr:FAD-dependent oxidoreductase [Mangrovactinospora gilvigrisea]OIV36168.1 pyridine nucleotide-disulfide oxidoreductase [Mangrovactinospora gilvigrisea]